VGISALFAKATERSLRLGREGGPFDFDPDPPRKTRIPPIVYHYTSADGFLGILESKKIRATAVEYLNDSKEIAFAIDAASSFISEKRDALFPAAYAPLADIVLEGLNRRVASGVFVACFCTNGDRLSQWRGYADKGLGFAMGFAGRNLADLKLSSGPDVLNVRFARCEYSEKSLLADVSAWCGRMKAIWAQLKVGPNRTVPTAISRGLQLASSRMIARSAPFIKHPQFHEEQEWRLVVDGLFRGPEAVKVRRGGAGLVPYVEIALTKTKGPIPIADLVVGPSAQGELARAAAWHALEANGVAKPRKSDAVELVRISKIPFRNW
jgi:Protein of unknown function (DUF2971)